MTRPFLPLLVERQMGETQLFVTDVKIEGKHHIVCRNEAEAEKSRKDREAIVAALDAQLKKGDKALVGNSGYRRYLRKTPEMKHRSAFEIDPGKLTQEARFDASSSCAPTLIPNRVTRDPPAASRQGSRLPSHMHKVVLQKTPFQVINTNRQKIR
jgi:hypothetical protein